MSLLNPVHARKLRSKPHLDTEESVAGLYLSNDDEVSIIPSIVESRLGLGQSQFPETGDCVSNSY